jgi:coproporphyrinogen III oxidase
MPVGCSIPEVVLILSERYKQQADKFHPACVTHDFCYRHGFATYGTTREECDTAIYDDMKKACKGLGGLGVLDVKEFGVCQVAANQTYEAIRRHGEKHYQTTTSTNCEYREDP